MRNHVAVSPDFGSKSSKARVARLVGPQGGAGGIAGCPFANGRLRPLLAALAVWPQIISHRSLVLRGNPGLPTMARMKNSQVIRCCAALSSLFVRKRMFPLRNTPGSRSVTLLTKNPRNEILSPLEVITTAVFCQYDNTID
jgi:hypothetical protein